jgi:hypothetical protein
MPKRFIVSIKTSVAVLACSAVSLAQNQKWNSPGLAGGGDQRQASPEGPAPRRDLSGIWDAGGPGVSGPGHVGAPFTAWGDEMARSYRPGNGPRMAPLAENNDPLSTRGDPAGFPRNVLYELRPIQIVHTPNQVLMLYLFEKRWRVIWTDGRELPKDPDPRWYGYSVGRWEDDYTLVVQSVGMDERTWLDNAGNPHSADLRVEERYRRVSSNLLELTVTINDPKAYTKPWLGRDKLALRLMPSDTDLMEMIPSATEAAEYSNLIANPSKPVK